MKYLLIIFIFLLTACSIKNYENTQTKIIIIKSPKIYIRDTGILHYLQNISDKEDLYGNPLIGNSWEGFVIEQIIEILPNK